MSKIFTNSSKLFQLTTLSLALVFSLTACGGSDSVPPRQKFGFTPDAPDAPDTPDTPDTPEAELTYISDLKAGEEDEILESGSSTLVTLKTKNNTGETVNDVLVNFSATCGTFEPASVSSSNQGDVSTTYSSVSEDGKLCERKQTITATPDSNDTASEKVDVNIAWINPNSVYHDATDEVTLGIAGSGSSKTGEIEFTIFANGVPAVDHEVKLDLIKSPTDFRFVSINNRASTIIRSDAAGKVKVFLYPGHIPGPVEIKASLVTDPSIFSLSKNVSVASGRVVQSGLSLSVQKNALHNNIDGDTTSITARMVDRQGNPIPDGTVISFVSEGGRVTPNCATANGVCSVELSTQDPRPINRRVTVLAFVEGEKQYIDSNADNFYNPGEVFVSNVGDFYRDDNENNQYDNNRGEFKYITANDQALCAASSFKQPTIPGTCSNKLDTVLREQIVFAFSNDIPVLESVSSTNSLWTFKLFGHPMKTVPLPSNTAVSVQAKDLTPNNDKSCAVEFLPNKGPTPSIYDLATPSTFGKNSDPSSDAITYTVSKIECVGGDGMVLTTGAYKTYYGF